VSEWGKHEKSDWEKKRRDEGVMVRGNGSGGNNGEI
jgi:hypothetical protein